jgi:hypothetical protein
MENGKVHSSTGSIGFQYSIQYARFNDPKEREKITAKSLRVQIGFSFILVDLFYVSFILVDIIIQNFVY